MRRRLAPLLLLALAIAGCVYYPTIPDVGGIRIRPQNGRAVRQPTGLALYMDLDSTGKYGDAVVGVIAPDVAKSAVLVDQAGQVVPRLEVPGTAVVRLFPQGPHILLTELARPVAPGEVVLITLVFEKVGNIGAITRVE
jgi:copper(I)-binding protein